MKKIAILLLISSVLSCGSSKSKRVVTTKSESQTVSKNRKRPSNRNSQTKTATKNNSTIETIPVSNRTIANIISKAESFEGVKYKYGGTTKKGMDCSGLLYTSFGSENIAIPRTSSALSTYGDWVDVKQVQEGDLLFFATRRNSRTINHVGMVTSSRAGRVEFIHASTSKGVMTSLLSERYWYFAFVQARRIL
ncbi:NlpC/P60 family protein [Olleya aquimaris]|uniref:C40 family peptidase n=1 Tax=Olleya sediminilitoris TaxID=2795739 RepID=A0ABS1WIY2_9FLAO|nr:C40 family peptidase [Olleya sediminilitoris]AXO81160.1 NlpC/P60 family protein [Olleya aquimaris]MBL7559080.1 C40 family peptidase [Olleya sediminilitoris]